MSAPVLEGHLLSAIIFQPLFTVLALLALEVVSGVISNRATRFPGAVWRLAGLVSSIAGALLAMLLWRRFDPAAGGVQLVERVPWLGDLGITYLVGVDGISILMVALTSLLLPVVLIGTWGEARDRLRHFVLFLLALQTGLLGAFLSMNLLVLYMFWEALAVPLYFLVGIWGGAGRARASSRAMIYGTCAGAPLLLVIAILAFAHYQHFGFLSFDWIGADGAPGIRDLPVPVEGGVWWARQTALFWIAAIAFAAKMALVPLHSWFPDAQVEAPTPVAVLLAAVVSKLGAYALLRFGMGAFPEAAVAAAPFLRALAVAGIVYAALLALAQTDVKRLIACVALGQMSFVFLGIFALDAIGIEGALLQMTSHGLIGAALLLLAGMLEQRRQARDLDAFAGVIGPMPRFAALFAVCAFAAMGLPALGGFVGELLIVVGSFRSSPATAAWAAVGAALGAVCLLALLRRMFSGSPGEEAERLRDLGTREQLVALALVIPIFWIGLQPTYFLNRVDRSTSDLLEHMLARGAVLPGGAGLDVAPVADVIPAGEPGP